MVGRGWKSPGRQRLVFSERGDYIALPLSRVCRRHAGYVALIRICCQVSDDGYVGILHAPWGVFIRCAQVESFDR